jgi:putative thioredoxin
MSAAPAVHDVTDASFATDVLDRSKSKPVVVDFWAPWCGPCRMLGPIIERVAAETNGEVLLAKLNTDENPMTAQRYQIQGIPAVKAFKDGKVVAEFTGAVPESQVRAFFAKLAPSPAERAAQSAQARAASGDTAGAEAEYRAALAASATNADAIVGLAGILLARGDKDEAERILSRIPTDRRAKVLKHRTFLGDFATKHANENLEAEASAAPMDPRARYRWGVMLAAREQYDDAFEELLASLRLDRKFADGAARKAILAIFDILGIDSPITREYQKRLSAVLF